MSWKTDTAFLAAFACAVFGASGLRAVQPGQPFPDWSSLPPATPGAGRTAGRVVVVDFWASWCAPCKASFPAYSKLQEELGPRGLFILGVSVDQDEAAFRRFVARLKPAFATVQDGTQRLAARARVPAMPTSYVLDRRGTVRFVHEGFHDDTAARLRDEVLKLLEESP